MSNIAPIHVEQKIELLTRTREALAEGRADDFAPALSLVAAQMFARGREPYDSSSELLHLYITALRSFRCVSYEEFLVLAVLNDLKARGEKARFMELNPFGDAHRRGLIAYCDNAIAYYRQF